MFVNRIDGKIFESKEYDLAYDFLVKKALMAQDPDYKPRFEYPSRYEGMDHCQKKRWVQEL